MLFFASIASFYCYYEAILSLILTIFAVINLHIQFGFPDNLFPIIIVYDILFLIVAFISNTIINTVKRYESDYA
ncbi:hypothetical protein FACS1894180_3540 [Bacteroidia bacterium]|nr:hypothetical protein FACS1894180_3540 [Bacteroidia bacterium]